ncbi:MAG: hypothetical protein MUF64_16640 [Polyangiaceae bacterium]|nr:hypothetical protein [Polyangiaceae bacterium]
MRFFPLPLLLACFSPLALAACSDEEPPPASPSFSAQPRDPADRTPRTAPCDEADPRRCLLPWPSSTFTRADPSSATGLRLAVEASSLFSSGDDPATLNLADGFSRVTPLATMFPGEVAPVPDALDGRGPIRLLLAQHDAADRGRAIPLRFQVSTGSTDDEVLLESLVLAFPLEQLAPASDYVVFVLDELPSSIPQTAPRSVRLSLGLEAPQDQQEAELQAYHAPTRALLAGASVDLNRVTRVWNFTTRSEEDPKRRLRAMREATAAAVAEGRATVAIEKMEVRSEGPVAAVVEGKIKGLPLFVEETEGAGLKLGASGEPEALRDHDAPFRVTLPAGQGSYRVVLFGHGTGGSYRNNDFDGDLAEAGVSKVSMQFYGWTDDEVIDTFSGFSRIAVGSHHSTARLMQAIADGAAIEEALRGPLGSALEGAELAGQPNPAAGRKMDASVPVWLGGSLGGTMGALYTGSAPRRFAGVFNVGGAAWTHFIPSSLPFTLVNLLLKSQFGGDLNVLAALATTQGTWDEIDGATWSRELSAPGQAFLIQESMGDPVLPNPGTEALARVTAAVLVGQPLQAVPGVSSAASVAGASALTQYRVASEDSSAIHGFAARNEPAGKAAREQIFAFLTSVWAGAPVITVPASCPEQRCDFSAP